MRFLIVLSLILSFCAGSSTAQVVKQPPKAVAENKNEFVSEEGGFRIKFPAKPGRTVSTIDTAFGKASYINFILPTTLAYYSIGFMDFPSVIDDKTELRARYDAVKAKLVSNEKVRFISETEIFYGDHLGREFVYETNEAAYTIRCFIIEQRFFQLTVGTRGKYVNPSEKVNSYNKKAVDNFINSFTVTKIAAPASSAVELPESFGIKVENGVFRSDFLKLTAELPKDWVVTEQEENEILKEVVKDSVEKEMTKNRNAVSLSFQNSRILLMSSAAPDNAAGLNAVFGIVAEKVAFPNFLPKRMIDDFPKTFAKENESVIKTTTLEKINGVEYAWLEILDSTTNYKKRLYIANRGGIAFEVVFYYKTPAELDVLLKILQSIKFDDAQTVNK